MNEVRTPDGYGQVLRTQSAHGRTSYLVKGAGFEGWYDGLEVTADFADHPDDVIPNDENDTVLPYPSRPQGPGWDGTTSTIPPDVDPHLELGGTSDSLTGESTGEDPVEADIEGLFEPPSRLAGVRPHRLHFAVSDDPILDVSDLPGESPTGLENSPINPDSVDTDDLFDNSQPHFERESSYGRLVIEDDLSFMRYASDDDKKDKKEQGPGQVGYPKDSDGDDDSGGDDSSSSDGDGSGDGSSSGDGGGGHTASFAFALSTTADLHFLANMCRCVEEIPLHSKSEHRELVAEGGLKNRKKKNKPLGSKPLTGRHDANKPVKTPADAGYTTKGSKGVGEVIKKKRRGDRPFSGTEKRGGADEVTAQPRDLDELLERYEQEQFTYQESNLDDLVDHSEDAGDGADLYNHYASIKTAAPAQDPGPTQIESQIEQLMQFWAVDNNGWWHWTGSQADLALLNQMQQQMMAVGMPGGPPGQMQAQSKTAAPAALAPLLEGAVAGEAAGAAEGGAASQLMGVLPGAGGMSPAGMLGGVTDALAGLNGGTDLSVARHTPFQTYTFAIEPNTPAPWREYLQTIASDKLVALAAWRDVVEKSKRLRSEGAIDLEVFKPEVITAYVQGDHGRYYTTVQRLGSVAPGVGRQLTSTQVSGWSCECDWGHWAWIRKRSFVGRMCSHAYALFSEMRSLDAKSRRNKGQPGRYASVGNKTSWTRTEEGGFEWVTSDPTLPTAAITRTASGWSAQIWSDGTADDSLDLGIFKNSGWAQRAAGRAINAHVKFADDGDVDVVGGRGDFPPGGETGYDNPYTEEGESSPEPVLDPYEEGPGPGIQESKTRVGSFSVFAEQNDGQDDEGPEETDDGIEEDDADDDESLDEEIAEDENDSADGSQDEGEEPEPADDGGHDEPHQRDDGDEDEGEGTDNPGDDSDDEGIEKTSSVAELQQQFGLTHLAGADYSLAEQDKLVREGDGRTARNRSDLNLAGTHYEASATAESPEDVLSFLF